MTTRTSAKEQAEMWLWLSSMLVWPTIFVTQLLPSTAPESSGNRFWCFFAGAMFFGSVHSALDVWRRIQHRAITA